MNYGFDRLGESEKFKVVKMEKNAYGRKCCLKNVNKCIIIPVFIFLYILFFLFYILNSRTPPILKLIKQAKIIKLMKNLMKILILK